MNTGVQTVVENNENHKTKLVPKPYFHQM